MVHKPGAQPRYEGDLQPLANGELEAEARKYIEAPDRMIFPRALAAEILSRVGIEGEHGGVAEGLTPYVIGWSVQRLVSNYESTDKSPWFRGFLIGLMHGKE